MNNLQHNLRQSLVNSTNPLFLIAIIFLLALSSCSKSEDAVSQPKLLSKIVEVATDNSTTATTFTYEGTKIVSTDSADKHATYIYTNDVITQIVILDKVTLLQSVLNYSYTNGMLVKVVSSDHYVMTFTHNEDGSVSYEKHTIDLNNNIITLYSGKMTFQNGNLIEDERTLGGTPANIVSKSIMTYQYDAKTNPMQNIIGYSKLLDTFKSISANNVTKTQVESRMEYLDTNQISSSDVLYVSVNQYDSDGYPATITSGTTFFGVQSSNHIKTQLFY
ncbi:MAG: hypothetical protein WCJ62_03820 [Flavobacterium sp.]